jgi:hypothetical protein
MVERKTEIWYFSYPADGTLKSFPKGVTEVNVRDGAIIFGDETKDKLSYSLRGIGVTKWYVYQGCSLFDRKV